MDSATYTNDPVKSQYKQIREFIRTTSPETPFMVFDTDIAVNRYRQLRSAFEESQIFYAVKANPEPRLIRLLISLGASFDVASPYEIDLCLAEGADPNRLSYGNTIKKSADIRYAYERGVRLFAFDSSAELSKLGVHAPGASVFCRLLISSSGARWPLGHKFGCSSDMAIDLLTEASTLGLEPAGVSFHVGSQQLEPERWEAGIRTAADVIEALRKRGISPRILNIGGGFATTYGQLIPSIDSYAKRIKEALAHHFGSSMPEIAIEPGRYVAAEAGLLRCQVVLISHKTYSDKRRWVYLDVGRFSGLAETEGEAIQYRLDTPGRDGPTGPVILAGPTCDSIDILYQHSNYELPLSLEEGDYIDILATGAYTTTYSSVGFNGFKPLSAFCVGAPAADITEQHVNS